MLKRISGDIISSMKAGDKLRTTVLRMTKSELNKASIDKGVELDEAGAIAVIQREVKRREEAALAFGNAGRVDLADRETSEGEILKSYLPAQLSEAEVTAIVREVVADVGAASPRDIGKVMKPVMAKVAGRADGKVVKQIVDQVLAS
jgi:uncharacterized protein